MAINTQSTDVEDSSPSNTSQLVGQTLLWAAASSVVEGSPLPLLNRTMVIGTCLLVKEVVHKTRRRLFNPNKDKDPVPSSPIGSDTNIDDDTVVDSQMLQPRTPKVSSHRRRTRDFHTKFFSKSLFNRESEYIYDTADAATYDRPNQNEVLKKSTKTEDSTNATIEVPTNEPWTHNLQQDPYELLPNTPPPPPPSPPSPNTVRNFADETIDAPSRTSSTTLVPKSTFLEGTSQMPMFDTEELVPKSTFLEGTSQMPMFHTGGGRARGIVKRMASVPLYVSKREYRRRRSEVLQVGRDSLS